MISLLQNEVYVCGVNGKHSDLQNRRFRIVPGQACYIAPWCNGNTPSSDPGVVGSSPAGAVTEEIPVIHYGSVV